MSLLNEAAASGRAQSTKDRYCRDLRPQPKTPFSRFPPVRRPDLEGQQRVDLTRSARRWPILGLRAVALQSTSFPNESVAVGAVGMEVNHVHSDQVDNRFAASAVE